MTIDSLELARCALLGIDLTDMIVDGYAPSPSSVVANANIAITAARSAGVPVHHIVPGGYDPVARHWAPTAGRLHPGLAVEDVDRRWMKARVGAFSTTGLDAELRMTGRDTLVLAGVSTSGCILSTARWAYDAGYHLVVVTDACADPHPDVHAALTEPVHGDSWLGLWRLGEVMTAAEVSQAMVLRPGSDS